MKLRDSSVFAIAFLLYAIQRSSVDLPAEILSIAESTFYIFEVLETFPDISLPSMILVSGLMIFADDWLNKWILGERIEVEFDYEIMIFLTLAPLLYFVRIKVMKEQVPQAGVFLVKGVKSSIGTNILASKALKSGLQLHSYQILFTVIFVKLGLCSLIEYIYSQIVRRASDLYSDLQTVIVKTLILAGAAAVLHSRSQDFAPLCDFLFLWWFLEKSLDTSLFTYIRT